MSSPGTTRTPSSIPPHGQKKTAVILGGGHAGCRAAQRLLDLRAPSDHLDVIIVSQETSEVYHGLTPQIVGGKVQPRHTLVPLRESLPGVTFYNYEVERIDLANRTIALVPVTERARIDIVYDYLVIALGSVTDLSRFPGLQEHGLQTKTVGDVYHLHDHLLEMLERASTEDDPAERRRLLTFVVVGAGYAGIEMGSEANNLLRAAIRLYPNLRSEEIDFSILSNTDRILPSVRPSLAQRAVRYLAGRGVRIRLNTTLAGANAGQAVLATGERIETRTIIVTAGITPNPMASSLPVRTDRGRIVTDEYCAVPNFPGVFAVGDNAAVPHPKTGEPCAASFLYAFTQGRRAAENIIASMRGKPLRRYRFNNFGEVAQLSHTFGLLECAGVGLSGFLASLLVRSVFFTAIPSWRCRFGLLSDWLSSIIFPVDVSRMKLAPSDTIVSLRFSAGQEIIREGDPGSRFYIVNTGLVEVVRKTADGEEIVARLGPGRYFGEVALLTDAVRTATVRAVEDTSVLSIARRDLKLLVDHLPLLEQRVADTTRTALAAIGKS